MIAPHMRNLALLIGSVIVASTITLRPAYSNGFHRGFFGKVGTVRVYCGYNTIGSALKRFPLRPLVIIVKGTCTEDVLIERDRVTLLAATTRVDGVAGQTDGGAAIKVAGAQNVVIEGLRVRSATGSSSAAVSVTGNGEAIIRDTLIEESGYGISANHGGFFLLKNSEIRDGRSYGLLLTDAANARVENSIVEVNNSDLGNSAAIGAFRSVNIRLRGNNGIRNNGDDKIPGTDDDGFSLDLFHNIEFRQDGGHTVFTGPMEFGNLTHGSLRDPEITGSIDVSGGSRVEIRKSSTGPNEIAGGRRISISGNSQLRLRSNTTADVGPIDVHEHSTLDLGGNATVNAAGSVSLSRSTVQMGPDSQMLVGGDFAAFNSAQVGVFGPYASLEVAGKMTGNSFFSMNIGDHSNLVVGIELDISDFSLMFAGNAARITANMDFGGSATKVNFFGDGVTYIGNMRFSSKSDVTFGPNNVIDGTINCNGSTFFAETPLMLSPGSSIVMCP